MGAIQTLEAALTLRGRGCHEEALCALVKLAGEEPGDAQVQAQAAFVHDFLGREEEAVPFYERAIAQGLSPELERECLLGLGSSYRNLGRYQEAWDILARGRERYPDAQEFVVFGAMAGYNLGRHHEAMALLLGALADTSCDETIKAYRSAIRVYASDLDRIYA
ncbi:tetratricopeptide repeat protein [Paludibacterium paludis]|uniref:Tetratrico peptide repeat group 5 domain-containing protein n=1 Tax=Paludibacterium paludis TaxID=1225769 RepID=A0A918NXI3_9NEIS|nr:tetratricopeptide repeat protein [Paludibacterium paludis]GGY04457.1 hypothetical protein GCM10011289_03710 [Paludibacterium paludis]